MIRQIFGKGSSKKEKNMKRSLSSSSSEEKRINLELQGGMTEIDIKQMGKTLMKSKVRELIESEFGLLDFLLELNAITEEEIDCIQSVPTRTEKIAKMLKYIIKKKVHQALLSALSKSSQVHVVNYITANEVYNEAFGLDWPLTQRERQILSSNRKQLIDNVDTDQVVISLYSQEVICRRQRELLNAEKVGWKRNEVLIGIVSRMSRKSFLIVIKCLKASNQGFLSAILEREGECKPCQENGADLKFLRAKSFDENISCRQETIKKDEGEVLVVEEDGQGGEKTDLPEQLKMDENEKQIVAQICCILSEMSVADRTNFLEDVLKHKFYRDAHKISFCDLKFDILVIVLLKAYLLPLQRNGCDVYPRDAEIYVFLANVDCRWSQIVSAPRFKRAVLRHLTDFYKRTKQDLSIGRINHQFFDETFDHRRLDKNNVKSSDVMTDKELAMLAGKNRRRVTNYCVNREYTDKLRKIGNYQRHTGRKKLAKVAENGGVVVRMEVSRKRRFSHRAKAFFGMKLRDFRIEVLNVFEDRDVIIWIWCPSSRDLQILKNMYISEEFVYIFHELTNDRFEINVDNDQWKKEVLVAQMIADFKKSLQVNFGAALQMDHKNGDSVSIEGVTKLKNRIYVIAQHKDDASGRWFSCMNVFDDKSPYAFLNQIEFKEIEHPLDVVSNEKETALYILDDCYGSNCRVWKITDVEEIKNNVAEWIQLDDQFEPSSMSMSSDGQLLLVGRNYVNNQNNSSDSGSVHSIDLDHDTHDHLQGSDESSSSKMHSSRNESSSRGALRVYVPEPSATLWSIISLRRDIVRPIHAVKTSTGNFIICHQSARDKLTVKVSLVSWSGKTIIRNFTPGNEEQKLRAIPIIRLVIDADDQVFMSDCLNHRVIQCDSNLRWKRILIQTTGAKRRNQARSGRNETIEYPTKFYYDEEGKQFLVCGLYESQKIDLYLMKRI